MLLTLRSGGIAVVVYAAALILTLTTTRLDDKLSLHRLNSTTFEIMEPEVGLSDMNFPDRNSFQCLYSRSSIKNWQLGGRSMHAGLLGLSWAGCW